MVVKFEGQGQLSGYWMKTLLLVHMTLSAGGFLVFITSFYTVPCI